MTAYVKMPFFPSGRNLPRGSGDCGTPNKNKRKEHRQLLPPQAHGIARPSGGYVAELSFSRKVLAFRCRLTPATATQPDHFPVDQEAGDIAAVLDTTPEWLAYAVRPDKEKIVYRAPEAEHLVWLAETSFGAGPDDRVDGERYGLPRDYLRRDLKADPDACIMVQVNSPAVEPHFAVGDRAIVDTSDTRPTPAGVFLYWDGIGASFATLQVLPRKEGPLVRITAKGNDTTELPLEDIRIIGRVKGRLQRV